MTSAPSIPEWSSHGTLPPIRPGTAATSADRSPERPAGDRLDGRRYPGRGAQGARAVAGDIVGNAFQVERDV
jgi:hypothetical protein